ncbi:MAG: site-specific integrase [Gammaproteobacteria bacterium]
MLSRFFFGTWQALERRGYFIRTKNAYADWVCRYLGFPDNRDPRELNEAKLVAFLKHWVVSRKVAPGTHNQALKGIVFRFGQVLNKRRRKILNPD